MSLKTFLRYFCLDTKVTQKIKAAASVRPTIGSFTKQKELALCAQTTFCFTLTSTCGFPAPSPMPVLTSPQERLGWLGGDMISHKQVKLKIQIKQGVNSRKSFKE
jgi:hypothetical protein